MFKGATIGGDVLLGTLGAEAATGQLELLIPELAVGGLIYGIKKGVEHHRDKKQNKKDQEEAQRAAQAAEAQAQIQRNAEAVARSQELRRQEAERQEAARQEAIRQEAARQQQRSENIAAEQSRLNQQRGWENYIDIQRGEDFANRQLSRQEQQREMRIREDIDRANGGQPWNLNGAESQPAGYNEAMSEVNRRYGQLQQDNAIRRQRLGLNPPDRDPYGGNPGGGGGMPGGGGGGGYNDPEMQDYYRIRDQERRNDLYSSLKNPAFDLVKMIVDKVQSQKNKEKESVQNAEDEEQFQNDQTGSNVPGNPGILGGDPATWSPGQNSWTYNPDAQSGMGILGNNPATWSPGEGSWAYNPQQGGDNPATQGNDYPGKNGGGIYNPNLTQETKGQAVLDNQHIVQEEIAGLIAQQGSLELTEEEQLAQLTMIDQKLDTLLPKQAQVSSTSIYSSTIKRFR